MYNIQFQQGAHIHPAFTRNSHSYYVTLTHTYQVYFNLFTDALHPD